MKKTLTLTVATILLAGCIDYKNDSNNLDDKITIDISEGVNFPVFVVPTSIPSTQAIAYNFNLINGSCASVTAISSDGSTVVPAPVSGDTYKADDFAGTGIANGILGFGLCSSGTVINVSFNGGKTFSYTV